MDSVRGAREVCSPEAVEFVRFCYRRRRAGWPELYDEMCAVASRGAYLGWSHAELADHGIGFGLFDLPSLAAIVRRVAAEENERRRCQVPDSGSGRHDAEIAAARRGDATEPMTGLVATVGVGAG